MKRRIMLVVLALFLTNIASQNVYAKSNSKKITDGVKGNVSATLEQKANKNYAATAKASISGSNVEGVNYSNGITGNAGTSTDLSTSTLSNRKKSVKFSKTYSKNKKPYKAYATITASGYYLSVEAK